MWGLKLEAITYLIWPVQAPRRRKQPSSEAPPNSTLAWPQSYNSLHSSPNSSFVNHLEPISNFHWPAHSLSGWIKTLRQRLVDHFLNPICHLQHLEQRVPAAKMATNNMHNLTTLIKRYFPSSSFTSSTTSIDRSNRNHGRQSGSYHSSSGTDSYHS